MPRRRAAHLCALLLLAAPVLATPSPPLAVALLVGATEAAAQAARSSGGYSRPSAAPRARTPSFGGGGGWGTAAAAHAFGRAGAMRGQGHPMAGEGRPPTATVRRGTGPIRGRVRRGAGALPRPGRGGASAARGDAGAGAAAAAGGGHDGTGALGLAAGAAAPRLPTGLRAGLRDGLVPRPRLVAAGRRVRGRARRPRRAFLRDLGRAVPRLPAGQPDPRRLGRLLPQPPGRPRACANGGKRPSGWRATTRSCARSWTAWTGNSPGGAGQRAAPRDPNYLPPDVPPEVALAPPAPANDARTPTAGRRRPTGTAAPAAGCGSPCSSWAARGLAFLSWRRGRQGGGGGGRAERGSGREGAVGQRRRDAAPQALGRALRAVPVPRRHDGDGGPDAVHPGRRRDQGAGAGVGRRGRRRAGEHRRGRAGGGRRGGLRAALPAGAARLLPDPPRRRRAAGRVPLLRAHRRGVAGERGGVGRLARPGGGHDRLAGVPDQGRQGLRPRLVAGRGARGAAAARRDDRGRGGHARPCAARRCSTPRRRGRRSRRRRPSTSWSRRWRRRGRPGSRSARGST